MFLKRIKLTNFRNYPGCDFNFKTPITVLVGNNAQGKTNLLESIYFLATTKSTRADEDEELIKSGEDFLRVEGELDSQLKLEVAMQVLEYGLKKRVKVNGIPKRVIDYAQNLAVVMFSPDDINLVAGAPSLRRAHIDQVLSQGDKSYKRDLAHYENVLVRKNRVLKRIREGSSAADELVYWSDQQVLLGALISEKRSAFFEFINGAEKKFGNFSCRYSQNPVTLERLKEYSQREIEAAASLVGPHRDDFKFFLEDLDLAKFGSRAQSRTAVLDLKLAEVSFFESLLGSRPVLLLDDIFSELDFAHRGHVLNVARLQQTVITAVEPDGELEKGLSDFSLFFVENGQISLKAGK